MSITVLLVILLVLVLFAGPYTGFHSYGWGPSGFLGALLLVLLLLVLLGYL